MEALTKAEEELRQSSDMAAIQHQLALTDSETKVHQLQKEIDALSQSGDEQLKQLTAELEESRKQANERQSSVLEKEQRISELTEHTTALSGQLENQKQLVSELNNKTNTLEKQIADLSQEKKAAEQQTL